MTVTPASWKQQAERAMADLRRNTGDARHDYYTRAAANFIPGLATSLAAAASRVEELEKELDDETFDRIVIEQRFRDALRWVNCAREALRVGPRKVARPDTALSLLANAVEVLAAVLPGEGDK